MRSGYSISWSDESISNLQAIIDYFEANWTEKELKTFFQKFDDMIVLISKSPLLLRLTNKRKNLRKCVFSRQTSIYYKFENRRIYIVSLFDNRSNPRKIKKIIYK